MKACRGLPCICAKHGHSPAHPIPVWPRQRGHRPTGSRSHRAATRHANIAPGRAFRLDRSFFAILGIKIDNKCLKSSSGAKLNEEPISRLRRQRTRRGKQGLEHKSPNAEHSDDQPSGIIPTDLFRLRSGNRFEPHVHPIFDGPRNNTVPSPRQRDETSQGPVNRTKPSWKKGQTSPEFSPLPKSLEKL